MAATRATAGVEDVELAAYSESYVYEAGDLDADGALDLFIDRYEYDFETDEETLEVEGASGVSGATLWESEGDFVFPLRAGDLDGDGGEDVILASWNDYTSAVAVDTMEISFQAIDGSDGSAMWTETFQDVWSYQDAFVGDAVAEMDWVEPGGIGDVDGDGINDLLLNRYNYAYACEYVVAGACEEISLSKTEALSGADGSVIRTFADDPAEQWQGGYLVDDATGDGMADVLVGRYTDAYELELGLLSGADADQVWETSIGDAWLYLDDVDHTGDGVDDFVVENYLVEDGDVVTSYQVSSLSDGEAVWTSDFAGEGYMVPAGDADADGGSELLVFDGSAWWDEEPIESMAAALMAGGSGQTVWSQELPGDSWIAGDVTGDGVEDISVDRYDFDEETDSYVGSTAFVSGSDAAAVWSRGNLRTSFLMSARNDLDGDGADDVFLAREGAGFTYQALRGISGEPLWAESVVLDGWVNDLTVAGGDVWEVVADGDGDNETISARRGTDGSIRWSRPGSPG